MLRTSRCTGGTADPSCNCDGRLYFWGNWLKRDGGKIHKERKRNEEPDKNTVKSRELFTHRVGMRLIIVK